MRWRTDNIDILWLRNHYSWSWMHYMQFVAIVDFLKIERIFQIVFYRWNKLNVFSPLTIASFPWPWKIFPFPLGGHDERMFNSAPPGVIWLKWPFMLDWLKAGIFNELIVAEVDDPKPLLFIIIFCMLLGEAVAYGDRMLFFIWCLTKNRIEIWEWNQKFYWPLIYYMKVHSAQWLWDRWVDLWTLSSD